MLPLHPSGSRAVLVAVVVHRCHGLLVVSLLWKSSWYLLVPQKPVLRREVFRSFQDHDASGSCV